MSASTTIVIVGAGLAGARAAEGARAGGFDGRIVIVGEEPHLPYERPPLSKAVLRGEAAAVTARVHGESFYAENGIEVVTGQGVRELDLSGRQAQLVDGTRIRFDTAVLATGAHPRRLDVPGAQLAGVHYLRTLDDAERLGGALRGRHALR